MKVTRIFAYGHLTLLWLFALHLNVGPTQAAEVSFRNDVMAIMSKAGCNAGPCHGNANGKASFKLSLRGEDPETDYLTLTHDQWNRRVNLLQPDNSLLLLKATGQIAHQGGQRFQNNSWEYEALRNWITQGAPKDQQGTPTLARIEVSPLQAVVQAPENTVQIKATAFYSDGSQRDVGKMAVYEPANTLVNISAEGLVEGTDSGETTVLVRFLDQQTPVRLIFVPQRPGFSWSNAKPHNYIDQFIFSKLQIVKANPSPLCSDEVFVRRAHLDLLGSIPTAEEARSFAYDPSPGKRQRLVDELLRRPEFGDSWALKWSDLLRNEERVLDRKGVELFHQWIRQGIEQGKPLDQFARELISARGSTYLNPAANYYRANRTPVARAEAAAQVFLGTRLQCAQCHNHPFDRWTQDDYYNWTALFGRIQYKVLENRRRDDNDGHEFKGEQVVFLGKSSEVKNARTGKKAEPRFLGATAGKAGSLGAEEDELNALAAWLTSAENPFFARVQVNRIWFHLMGRGIVDPVDDIRASNPATHPELLDALARDFREHGYDLRHIIRIIMNSAAYQLSSEPNETNADDLLNYSHNIIRRLSAEQLLDSKSDALKAPLKLTGYPLGARATQMAGALPERKRDQRSAEFDTFLAEFGKPPRLLPSDCERTSEPTMGQAFQFISGPVLQNLLTKAGNRIDDVQKLPPNEAVAELYWSILSRAPSMEELNAHVEHLLKKPDSPRASLEDIAWSLINSKEFLLRH